MSLPAAPPVYVGCAGWSLPRAHWPQFPAAGSHLQRYAGRFNTVEINSSFYRPHQHTTYARWATSVPADFRFSAKLPQTITHEQRLQNCNALLDEFLAQVTGLSGKLGALLVQLPPSLAFDEPTATSFFQALRRRHTGAVALEPRHASWFTPEVDNALTSLQVARVLADPVRHVAGTAPGGWPGLVYLRLHGSPRMYYSAYDRATLQALTTRLQQAVKEGAEVWCIFDNTAEGAAVGDALELNRLLAAAS